MAWVLLPVPKQVYGRLPRRFKNMNISTQDTSYEGGADEREEIARLWEHIQKQDLVIEQSRNQQGSHENNETARENHQENFADNSQTHVANFVRKRVCNTPDQQGFLTRERETTLNKDTLVENHDMYTAQKDNGLAHQHGSSSIPLSTNGFLQELNVASKE
ncbi:uncharacterized protein LOC104583434 [Brachypodium distachyon]|uniref:uncharacterized protein LOC104583434 n=1 Tax=Brachypodium distachyon TaxID=15368 RepID=UPI000D0DBEC3|nr:uncharacterized protein LOC104583434 [Brachypodium distachyon]|eukprot:XP_024316482.1 uncharacterized protein LOC104583434 [Brachypodium distachyon]